MSNDSTIIELIDLHPKEVALIKKLRTKYRYGEITIIVHEGIPRRFKRIIEGEEI